MELDSGFRRNDEVVVERAMFEHPVLSTISREGFVPLGWFTPRSGDGVPAFSDGNAARFVILIGNAGPAMFRRFARERKNGEDPLDEWCAEVVRALAETLGARAVFPSDEPALPFLTWARRSGASHASPLGLNIHAYYGLWHAYRAALLFPVVFDLPQSSSKHPCETCMDKPCLTACPVHAFSGSGYDVEACVDHIASAEGAACMSGGCLARRACPVGQHFAYEPEQMNFHMLAFRKSRLAARRETS
jgi:hypothetical protein